MNSLSNHIKQDKFKLSICIATYKRGAYIAQTLDSIIGQLQPNVEIIVVDGASPDNTSEVVERYATQYPCITYYRETENSGVDRDYDKAIQYASGEYCWLMTDDDLMLENAIDSVLEKCDSINDLVVVNALVKDNNLSATYNESLLKITNNGIYTSKSVNQFYRDCTRYLSFIGGVVTKRDFWLERDRATYYGTAFIHIGVLLQLPPPRQISVISKPLIAIRYGNAMWKPQTFKIWMKNWPSLIGSFGHIPLNDRLKITQNSFFGLIKQLIIYRAQGYYTYTDYLKFNYRFISFVPYIVSVIPVKLINGILSASLYLFKSKSKMLIYDLATSKYSTKISKLVASKLGIL